MTDNGAMTFSAIRPDEATPFRIIFVCTGNICRSPMAEITLRDLVTRSGLGRLIFTSSAGTGDWHVGEQAAIGEGDQPLDLDVHPRAVESGLRQVLPEFGDGGPVAAV